MNQSSVEERIKKQFFESSVLHCVFLQFYPYIFPNFELSKTSINYSNIFIIRIRVYKYCNFNFFIVVIIEYADNTVGYGWIWYPNKAKAMV